MAYFANILGNSSLITMDSFTTWGRRNKVVFIMGQTGTGKSRLSVDLATRFSAEIINCDKIQVYKGLDIVTNKVTLEEQCGIPHHLLGEIDPTEEFTASDFRRSALHTLESTVERGRLPIIVGGSNSFIEALVDDEDNEFRSNYECCFLWVDVYLPLLNSFLCKRVDQMVNIGLVDEVRDFFERTGDYTQGIRRAIGVPEMHRFLESEETSDEETSILLLEQGINEIKINTCELACRQVKKIQRLRSLPGWNIHRIDATDVFRKNGRDADEAWERQVLGPSTMIVGQFLYNDEEDQMSRDVLPASAPTVLTYMNMGMAVEAATH